MIVIDASSLAKYLLREENWREIEGYLLEPVYSIDHVVKEVTNAIWKHARTHRYISRNTALVIYNQLKRLVDEKIILIEPQEKYLDRAFIIALDNDIPIYDALYIAQALEYKKLLTSDNKQATIAKKLGIETILIS
ncbi:MAG: type II toxin-antitoxin system VapC family toxin [Sulfolobales archaeon]